MIRKLLTIGSACLLAVATLPLAATAQPAPEHPLKPLLWKVEGGDLKAPSWLFGTIHLGTKEVTTLHPAAAKALAASEIVYTEIPMDPATQMGMAIHLMRKDGSTLSDSIGPELKKLLAAELKAINPQLSPEMLDTLKTWAIAVTVPMLKDQMAGNVALDALLWQQAGAAGKTTRALETAVDQIRIFDQLNEQEQIALLKETLTYQGERRAEDQDPIQELVDAYVAGDPKAIEELTTAQFEDMAKGDNKELGAKLKKQVFDDRNVSMATTILGHLKAEPATVHFFAVGVGHYIGSGNIGEHLRKKGYIVTLFQP